MPIPAAPLVTIRSLTERVQSMGARLAAAETSAPAIAAPTGDDDAAAVALTNVVVDFDADDAGDAARHDALVALMGEIEKLDERYRERSADAASDIKRHLADLADLHHANRQSTVGALTAGLAHEFGTPLGIILARSQMILADEADLNEARLDAAEVVAQVKRMTAMCRELLEYARPRPAERERLDVVVLTRQMVNLLQLDARKRHARLTVADDPAPCFVLGEASKIMQVLSNLIINAAQAMPKGGQILVSIEANCAHDSTRSGTDKFSPPDSPRGGFVCVHVKDEGTGISAANLPRIFETFFTTKSDGEGSGIGLAVSQRIAREHGGFVAVATEEDVGSTFTLGLPMVP